MQSARFGGRCVHRRHRGVRLINSGTEGRRDEGARAADAGWRGRANEHETAHCLCAPWAGLRRLIKTPLKLKAVGRPPRRQSTQAGKNESNKQTIGGQLKRAKSYKNKVQQTQRQGLASRHVIRDDVEAKTKERCMKGDGGWGGGEIVEPSEAQRFLYRQLCRCSRSREARLAGPVDG